MTATELVAELQGLVELAQGAERFEIHHEDGTYESVTFFAEALNHFQGWVQHGPHVAAAMDRAIDEHQRKLAERDASHV